MSQLDYALIGNCQISALIDKKAQYVWCCMPRFDSPSIFAALLGGEDAGIWSFLPDTDDFETRQRYIKNTNVIQTEFHLKNGDRFDIIDFAPRFSDRDGSYRLPQLMRIIRPIKGNPRVRVVFKPMFDYGKNTPEISPVREGLIYRNNSNKLYFQTNIPLTYILDSSPFELSTERYCVLSHGEPFEHPLKFGCEEFYDRTVAYWRNWVKHSNIPFEYQDAVIRSALALKLHIFEDTGAIIAATTTSIPESTEGGRTWDYRYCWLRDAYFVINVLNRLGQFDEMERFIQYLHNIAVTEPGADLQPVYGIGGERELHEKELPWLPGFKNLGPVRIGNAAYTHAQYDVYGEMVLAIAPLFFDSRLDRIDLHRAFESVVQLVRQAIHVFDKPDSGIWEFRGERRHYTFSKIMCWAAVDRGIKIAKKLGQADLAQHWIEVGNRMRQTIETKAWNHDLGYYTQDFGGTNADASNLLMHAINFTGNQDEKWRQMIENYEPLLMENGYAFRYRAEDDFGKPKNAFTICTFWMVDALISVGRKEEARRIFEKVLSAANHVGLLSEDVDSTTGELWGNFPQTYSHVGIITSAFRLSKSWDDAF